jgi:hypothetical protein
MENRENFRVIVWDCKKGEVAQDFMSNSVICGYDAEKDGRKNFTLFFATNESIRGKIASLKYMRKACKSLIKIIRREKKSDRGT